MNKRVEDERILRASIARACYDAFQIAVGHNRTVRELTKTLYIANVLRNVQRHPVDSSGVTFAGEGWL